jgi:hypothetical protein
VSVPPNTGPAASPRTSVSSLGAIVSLGSSGEPALDHRPLERDLSELSQPDVQRCDVAVADQDLGMAARLFGIEQGQQLDAAVPAAHGDDAVDRRILPRAGERCRTQRGRAGQVPITREHRLLVDRLETKGAQFGHTTMKGVGIERARGGNDGEPGSGAERGRLAERKAPRAAGAPGSGRTHR